MGERMNEAQLNDRMTAARAAVIIADAGVKLYLKGEERPLREWIAMCPRDAAGVAYWPVDTSGKLLATETNSALALAANPYASDGAALKPGTVVESYARAYTAAADGSLAAAELLPSAGAGLKWVIWDLQLCTRAGLTGGTGGRFALSDMASGKGAAIEASIYGIMTHPGPYKQGTANTAVNISAGVAGTTNNATIFATFRCAKVA